MNAALEVKPQNSSAKVKYYNCTDTDELHSDRNPIEIRDLIHSRMVCLRLWKIVTPRQVTVHHRTLIVEHYHQRSVASSFGLNDGPLEHPTPLSLP